MAFDADAAARLPIAGSKTSAQAAHNRATETLDLVALHTIEECDTLIKELNDIKDFMIADCARVKSEVAQHVENARAMKEQTEMIREFVTNLKTQRLETIRARVI